MNTRPAGPVSKELKSNTYRGCDVTVDAMVPLVLYVGKKMLFLRFNKLNFVYSTLKEIENIN